MLKKLHLHLTLICTACTAVVVVFITVTCLYISEKGLKEKEYGQFLTALNSCCSHLQSESIITSEWLGTAIHHNAAILYIEDNGIPIALIDYYLSQEDLLIAKLAKDYAAEEYRFDISSSSLSKVINRQETFSFTDSKGLDYYGAAAYIPKSQGYLGVIFVYPLKPFHTAILRQRIIYGTLVLFAILILFLFSFWFTRHTIRPIEKNREKQVQFIASASHELRSPLTVIGSSMTAMKKADAQRAERFETIIQLELKRMKRLIEDMLALSRSDSESWNLQFEKTSLNELLKSIADRFTSIAEKKEIQLLLPDFPSCFIRCDAQRIEQVLIILLDNALAYNRPGDHVTITIVKSRRKVAVKVTDTGPGIADADKKNIFDRFYRADPARESKEHYGLGLAIAAEIIQLHKGQLNVEDTPGGGATFIISGLPLL